MTGKFTPEGNCVGVTILSVPIMKVSDLRTKEDDGYRALRLVIHDSKSRKDIVKEIRTDEVLEPGTEIKFEEIVKPGDKVKITGLSKGKGFAGVVKRYHFKGGPRTHGQSDRERAPGSSGSTTTPGRVTKGKRRAGHMGNENVTSTGQKVLEVNADNRTLVIGGGIPGSGNSKGNLIIISKLP